MSESVNLPGKNMVEHPTPISYRPMVDRVKIELVNVHKTLGGKKVLDGIFLEIRDGETMCILGGSGAGKSVTIKHIVGLVDPDSGEVLVFGKDPARVDAKERIAMRLRVGYLFQSGALLNWMTIGENVELPLVEHRRSMTAAERYDYVGEKLRLVEMDYARDKYPSDVSGGMIKRAALARAIVLEPDIVLYDEPTSGLDPVIANTINDLIVHTQKTIGTTQVVVTHDMESAYRIADRIAMLYEGRIVAVGTVDQIRTSDNPIVQQFITGNTRGPLSHEA